MYPCLVTSNHALQKCILCSFILNQKSVTNFSSLSILNGIQNSENVLCRHFLIIQLIFNNGLHTAMSYSDFCTNLIYCYGSVTFNDMNLINFFKHYTGFWLIQMSQILHNILTPRKGLMLCKHLCF